MEDSPLANPHFPLPTRQLIPARSCTAQYRIGMTNGTGTPHSSLARKNRRVRPGGPTNSFQRLELHRLGRADVAIVRLNNGQTGRSESQHSAEKTKDSQNEHGDGNLRGQRKARKPAFILLTREIHSGLKWVEVD